MSENPKPKSRVRFWIQWPLVVFVVYLLSWGVVFAMYGTGRIQMPVAVWVKNFYLPVAWLHDHTFLARPLESYLTWWAITLTRR